MMLKYFWLFLLPSLINASVVEQSIEKQKKTIQSAVQSQKKIDQLAAAQESLLQDYRQTLQQIRIMQHYNQQLKQRVQAQQQKLQNLQQQFLAMQELRQGLQPLMQRMVAVLHQLVELDLPFLQAERQERVKQLETMLLDSELSLAEQYQRILEAYQIELDYGRQWQVYTDELNGQMRRFLRLGRVALYYQSLDGQQAAIWNPRLKQWQNLPDATVLKQAIPMAESLMAPDLIVLPLPTAEVP